jgi:hypothetical protein
MDRSSSHKSISSTTKMVRVVLSGVQKQASPWEKLLSLLWIIGALLVIVVYLMIPILIALRHLPSNLFELFSAACILLIAELLVTAILLKIARPARTPSVSPQLFQLGERFFATPRSAQTIMPDIDQFSTLCLPATPFPEPTPGPPTIKKQFIQPSGLLSLPATDGEATESLKDLLANLQTLPLPSYL